MAISSLTQRHYDRRAVPIHSASAASLGEGVASVCRYASRPDREWSGLDITDQTTSERVPG